MNQLKAVILDWAGTMVDHGSLAPLAVFRRAFAAAGVEITDAEARAPMGLPKWRHIQAVGNMPRVAAAWAKHHGRPFTDADVDRLHASFLPMTIDAVADRAGLVPGALAAVEALRARGLKIGSTTGYDRPTMEALLPLAAAQGYVPDCVVTASDLPQGRPSPLMMYRCFIDLQVWPAALVVKVDDTAPGIGEGLSAGSWTVGVAATGSPFGLSAEQAAALPPEAFAARRAAAAKELTAAGAHYVIDGVRDLPPLLDIIERRLAAGERP
jgi:phosphonoacetaldehyde hydrolase